MQPHPLRATIAERFDDVLVDASYPGWPGHSRGKVRDSYDLADGTRLIIATDRQSAFDQVLAAVPFKGQVLNSVARFWFDATQSIIANHVLAYPDPNVLLARRLCMLPVEIVVRDYLTGATATSLWTMYEAGTCHAYGIRLPEGLRKNEKLPMTVITPTTKGGDGEHDRPIAPAEIVREGLLTGRQWDTIANAAIALFDCGRRLAAMRGLILVDTKYEFGIDTSGDIVLADEIHTPDSSRYWIAETYAACFSAGAEPQSLDKDFLRRWISARCDPYRQPIPAIPRDTLIEFAERYIALYETICGERFAPPPRDPPIRERIRRNIAPFFNAAQATALGSAG